MVALRASTVGGGERWYDVRARVDGALLARFWRVEYFVSICCLLGIGSCVILIEIRMLPLVLLASLLYYAFQFRC